MMRLRKQLALRAVTGAPLVRPGEKATIYVTVVDEEGQIVPGATVVVEASGGKFLKTAKTAYDPSARLRGPSSVSGQMSAAGIYTAWWVCNPCSLAYVMAVKASKEGYIDGSEEVTVHLR
jgi:hypothetical protein